ncbi:DUF1707 SHOCT-like domain-containing protein [Actinacidiphila yeochonensis]|uniref:DUF1707 SHOCT-like domain-containing protein n=1 Tax=Actinacidiphila yeochonensis TaxID=89050 RepID=UPI000AD18FF1|nr:DUF1707 domain-containing protein [Actinacidiphila yeochonensis]
MSEPSPAPPSPAPSGEAHLRASDDEREYTAALLGDALAAGRITVDEHADRLDSVYAARTRGELAPLTADLPEPRPGADLAVPGDDAPVIALFSKVRRSGQWPVPAHTVVRARFGAVFIDLRQAVFTRRAVVIDAGSFCGKVEILVPDNAEVYDTGSAVFGKRSGGGRRDEKAGEGPVIRVTGRSVFGHVRVMRGFRWPWRENR